MTTHRPPNCGPAWFRGANRLLDGAAGLFQTAAELLLTVMLVINFANIVLRNIGQPSLLWVSPWTLVLMVWAESSTMLNRRIVVIAGQNFPHRRPSLIPAPRQRFIHWPITL